MYYVKIRWQIDKIIETAVRDCVIMVKYKTKKTQFWINPKS